MNYASEINIIANLVKEYWTTVGGLEGNRIQHYGESAIQKLRNHNFSLEEDERVILLEAINTYGSDLPLVKITSLLNHPFQE